MEIRRIRENLIEECILDSIVLLFSSFIIGIGLKLSIIPLVVIGILAIVIYTLFITYSISKIIHVGKLFKQEVIYSKDFDKQGIIDMYDEKKEKHDRVVNKIAMWTILIVPFLVGAMIIIGVLIDNYLISFVFPGWILALALFFLLYRYISKKIKKSDDERLIDAKSKIVVCADVAFVKGSFITWNYFGIKCKYVYDNEKKAAIGKLDFCGVPFSTFKVDMDESTFEASFK